MGDFKNATAKDWFLIIGYVVVFFIVIAVGAYLLVPANYWLWLIIVAMGLFLLVQWHARTFVYCCSKCGNEFEISTFVDFVSLHGFGKKGAWKYLRCPKCQKWSRATLIKKFVSV